MSPNTPPDPKLQTCIKCSITFESPKLLLKHNKDSGHFRCRLCGKALKSIIGVTKVCINQLSFDMRGLLTSATQHGAAIHPDTDPASLCETQSTSFDQSLDFEPDRSQFAKTGMIGISDVASKGHRAPSSECTTVEDPWRTLPQVSLNHSLDSIVWNRH